jgi:hypothetical protein
VPIRTTRRLPRHPARPEPTLTSPALLEAVRYVSAREVWMARKLTKARQGRDQDRVVRVEQASHPYGLGHAWVESGLGYSILNPRSMTSRR